jgi:hypothetical protein
VTDLDALEGNPRHDQAVAKVASAEGLRGTRGKHGATLWGALNGVQEALDRVDFVHDGLVQLARVLHDMALDTVPHGNDLHDGLACYRCALTH